MRYQRLADGRCLLKDFSSVPDICRDSAFLEWRIYATGNEFGWLLNNGERYGKKVQAKIIEVLFPSKNPLDAELKFVHEDLQGKTVTAVIPVLAFGDWLKPVWKKTNDSRKGGLVTREDITSELSAKVLKKETSNAGND